MTASLRQMADEKISAETVRRIKKTQKSYGACDPDSLLCDTAIQFLILAAIKAARGEKDG